jgi:type IV secretion system protein TrbL
MAWLRRACVFAAALAAAGVFAGGSDATPQAAAITPCVGISPASAITGVAGIGDPVGDACEAVADAIPDPLGPIKDAASSIGKGVFEQITSWAAEGATYLLGQVAKLSDQTTTPDLLSKGFLRQYRGMASIATVLALLMLVFAVLESLGRGDGGMLVRVFLVNVPLAAIATSAAYVVVQLMVATTDGFCEAITHATAHDTEAFFKSAIEGLSSAGGDAGKAASEAGGVPGGEEAGAVAVPLFVGFITAMIAALAAFLVWIELLMRDAAIYAVALFMPMAIAASIWPRWMSALRRTGELLIVVVFSKFVIVSVIALAASLMANSGGDVEHVLAAGALLLLACFAPFVLFKLVPFAEGAVSAAYNRQGAGGAAVRTVEFASSVSMMRRAALANWAAGGAAGGRSGGGSSSSGAGAASSGRHRGGTGGADAGGASGEAAGASGAAGAVALPVKGGAEAARSGEAAAGRLADSGTSQAAGSAQAGGGSSGAAGGAATGGGAGAGSTGGAASSERARRPASDEQAAGVAGGGGAGGAPSPEPTEAAGGSPPGSGGKPPRPAADAGKGERPEAKS